MRIRHSLIALIGAALLCASGSAAPLIISVGFLPNGTVGAAYNQTLSAIGGKKPFKWSISAGALPPGLDLDASDGKITGTPSAAGAFTFSAKVTDKDNDTDTQSLRITVDPAPPAITTTSLPDGTVGSPYAQSLSASGGTGTYTWTSSGALPAGLTMNSSGTIAGTPTTAGTFNFTATASDGNSRTASKPLSITIALAPLTVVTPALPPGTVGTTYSQTLTASGGSGGYTWTTTAGSLPAGLTLSTSGTISGTPTDAVAANFTITVRDSGSRTASKSLTITISPAALTVTTALLPNGTVGTAYSQTLVASGGSGGNTWTTTAGALPAGLTLSASGTISGTPTAAGTANFTATVRDSGNRTASKPLTIGINPAALTVTTTSLPNGTAGTAYSQTLTSSGGSGGNAWSLSAGALPAGLTLAANGAISGTPTSAETANFTVQVKDSANVTATKPLTLTIAPTALTISTDFLPAAAQGTPYSFALTATGGTGGYRWSLAAGALPTGLTLDPGGRISGTSDGATTTFTIAVADSSGAAISKPFTLTVTPRLTFSGPSTLPSGVVANAYSTVIPVTGGVPPYTVSVVSGTLPAGLTLNAGTGELSGRPTQAGTSTFTLQVRDAAGTQAQTPFTLTIANGVTITTQPVLPGASISVAYQATLQAAGGTPPYSWSVTAGALPGGLTFHSDGKIDGTPTASGSFAFTAAATDSAGARATKDFTLSVAAGLTITTAPQLPPGVPGSAYSETLVAIGGRPPYVWSISAGALPSGVRLDAATGALAGTPATAGTFNFTASVTDSGNVTAQKALTLAIAPGVTFTTASALPNAVVGTAYAFTLRASGGQTPYTWRIADGSLPAGLSLNSATGAIAGTPTATGTYNFNVEVADAGGLKASRLHTIVSELPTAFPTLSLTGLATDLPALQQPTIDLTLSGPYPAAITGRLNLTFTPASGLTDDPSVQFSSGGRSATFTIPANDTHATFSVPRLAMQSGSVAGTIQLTVDLLRAGAVTMPPPTAPLRTTQVSRATAGIRSISVTRSSSGFEVQIVGLSNTREVSGATVRFRPGTTEVTVPLTEAARAWFQSAGSTQYGGQFTLTLPFTFSGGTVAVESVGVVLSNTVGASQEVSAQY